MYFREITVNPYVDTLANSEDLNEIPKNVTFHQVYPVCEDKNYLQTKKYNII